MHLLRPSLQSKFIPTAQILKRALKYSSTVHRFQDAANTQGQLAGKHCIITGASRGIGAEIARGFAREGANCLLIGRNEAALWKVKVDLENTEDHRVLVGDVGDGEFWVLLKKEVGFFFAFR